MIWIRKTLYQLEQKEGMFKLKKNRIDLWLPEEQKQEKGNVCRLKVVPMTLSEVVEMEKGGKVPNKTSESCLKNL